MLYAGERSQRSRRRPEEAPTRRDRDCEQETNRDQADQRRATTARRSGYVNDLGRRLDVDGRRLRGRDAQRLCGRASVCTEVTWERKGLPSTGGELRIYQGEFGADRLHDLLGFDRPNSNVFAHIRLAGPPIKSVHLGNSGLFLPSRWRSPGAFATLPPPEGFRVCPTLKLHHAQDLSRSRTPT